MAKSLCEEHTLNAADAGVQLKVQILPTSVKLYDNSKFHCEFKKGQNAYTVIPRINVDKISSLKL